MSFAGNADYGIGALTRLLLARSKVSIAVHGLIQWTISLGRPPPGGAVF